MTVDCRGLVQKTCKDKDSAYCTGFRVGGMSVMLAGEHFSDVALVPSLMPFRVETGASDINIQVKRAAEIPLPSRLKLFDSGSVWRLYSGNDEFEFDFTIPIFGESPYKRLVVDHEFRWAQLLVRDECFADVGHEMAPLDYPLDELLIMHRLTQEKAIELHGCGIVTADGIGNLFVGHSGAGKSTTTRLWTASQDVEVLSDDRIILRHDEARRDDFQFEEETPRKPANIRDREGIPFDRLRAGFRLRSDFAKRSRCFAQDDKATEIRMYGTPWHGEAAFASPASAPLKRICILEHGHGNVLTLLSPSQAIAELFARSFVPFHRHEYLDSALEFLQEVVQTVPCYRYAFEPDQGAVDTILNLHD